MRKRNSSVLIRFSDKELEALNLNVEKSGLSRESYIRAILNGKTIKELPPMDFINVLKELRHISTNMNQIALVANSTGLVDRAAYSANYSRLQEVIGEIMRQVYS